MRNGQEQAEMASRVAGDPGLAGLRPILSSRFKWKRMPVLVRKHSRTRF